MAFDISGVLRDAHIDELPQFLNISTCAGTNSMRTQLTMWSSSRARLEARSNQARCLKSVLRSDTRLRPLFNEFTKVEPTFNEVLTAPTELEEESYSQLFFQNAVLRPLNHIPLFVAVLTFMKKTIIPALMVSMPILTIIAPYIIIRYIMKLPLTFKDYIITAKNTYFGQTSGGPVTSLKQLMQIGGFLFTTIHSVYQPIQAMMHIRSIDTTVRKKADDIIRGIELYEQIRTIFDEYGIRTPRLPLPTDIISDRHRLMAFVLEHPFHIRLLLDWIGTWDVSVALAQCSTITCVNWIEGPQIFIKSTCDTRICPEKQKRFTIQLGGDVQKNILLTGPNRGGKSTVLRALIRSVLLAHTYGVAIGTSCRMSPLDWVKSSLRIEDLPGSQSLFEREISFARDTLSSSHTTNGLVCIDEIFHSTNPPDSERTARKYLTALWGKTNTLSVISTHIYPIAEDAPEKTVRRMCCPADELPDGRIVYQYGLKDGICKVSSVNDIIRGAFDN